MLTDENTEIMDIPRTTLMLGQFVEDEGSYSQSNFMLLLNFLLLVSS